METTNRNNKMLENIKAKMKQIIPAFLWKKLSYLYHNLPLYLTFINVKFIIKRIVAILNNKKILFYPKIPHDPYVIFKICFLLGYKKNNNLNSSYNLAVHWNDATIKVADENLNNLSKRAKVINLRCKDISKKQINTTFREVFGYSLAIDPLNFSGICVKKSDSNGRHDGEVIKCPVDRIEDGFVYQKLVNNCVDNNLVQDIRIPILKNRIPFAYLKYRPIHNRFSNENSIVKISKLDHIISEEEKEKILLFCEKIGLDYGELDVARDIIDKKLYILDVNNTPFGPPNHLPIYGYIVALKKLTENFEEVFMR